MHDIIKDDSGGLISLLHGKGGGLAMPKPFARDIFLFETHVAGTTHVSGIEELEPHLLINDRLDFIREPDNPHDPLAIMVRNADGAKIGYVPMRDNAVFSRLMDAGKLLFGRITHKEKKGGWLEIKIHVFLHE